LNAPTPPLDEAPAPSAARLALRAVQIGKVNLDDIWLAAEREVSRAQVTGDIHLRELRAAAAGSVKARMHAQIAAEAFATRDCFFAMCRLADRIKVSDLIKKEIRRLADIEASDQAALTAAYLSEIEREHGGIAGPATPGGDGAATTEDSHHG